MRKLTCGRSERFMLISSERVFYAGLHGKPSVRTLGALAVCVPLHGTARLEIAGQEPRVSEILAVPAYLPHTITSESREILGLLIEPESVCALLESADDDASLFVEPASLPSVPPCQ